MAGFETPIDEARELFRQAGIDVGGRHIFGVSVAHNGPAITVTVIDIDDNVWLWSNQDPATWAKLPRVPFLTPSIDAPAGPPQALQKQE